MPRKMISLVIVAIATASCLALVGLGESGAPPAAADEVLLPPPVTSGGMSLAEAIGKRRSVRRFAPTPLTQVEVSQLCWAAQGITEPDQGLRASPSAMATYPVDVFMIDATGLYQYDPGKHALRRLAEGDMLARLRSAVGQAPVRSAPACMLLALDYERSRGRCGDRAERYGLLEAGHIAQNVLLAATAMGLAGCPVGGMDEHNCIKVLGLPEKLVAAYLLPIGHPEKGQ